MTSRYQEEVYVPIGIVSYLWLVAQSQHFPNLVNLLTRSGIPLDIAAQIIGFYIPGFIVAILPTAILVGTFFLARRTSHPNSQGSHSVAGSLRKGTLIGLGVLASLVSFGINEFLVPSANSRGRKLEFVALYKCHGGSGWSHVTDIERGRGQDQDFARIYHMGMFYGTTSENVLVVNFIQGEAVKIIKADSGKFDQSNLHLKSARVITCGKDLTKVKFDKLTISDTNNFQSSLRYAHTPLRDMSARDLSDYLRVLNEANTRDSDILMRLYQKLVSPFDCLLFALLGAQLAYIFCGRSIGLTYATAIFIVYSGLQVGSEVIAPSNRLTPFFAAALPTIFLALMVLILSLNSLRHRVRSPQLSVFNADLRFILSLFGMLP